MTNGGGSGRIAPDTKAAGDDVREIASIGKKEVFDRWGKDIDSTVVLSDERIGHIMERHPGVFEQYGKYTAQAIQEPDYILEDIKNDNTAAFIRRAEEGNLNVIVKLAIKDSKSGIKSSVITMYPLSAKRLRRMIKNAFVVYRSSEV